MIADGGARNESSFYESFSDLIFGTLVVFLVLVMALVLQVDQAEKTATELEDAAQLVHTGRFAGGTEWSTSYVAHLQIANRLHVLWVPVSIATRWSLSWAPENGESALVELCRLLLESRDDAIMTLDTYLGLGDGLSKAYLSKQLDHAPISKAAMVALTFLSREPERAWTAESLAEAMGGRRWNERSPTHPGPIEAIISEHRQWLYGVAGSKHYGLSVSRDKVLERMAAQPDDGPPRIQFSLVGHEVQVGDSTMDPGAFLMMLRSTKPGKGFFIEYLAPLGQNDVPPPAWFREEVMGPAGFTTRVLTPAGEAALLVRGGTK